MIWQQQWLDVLFLHFPAEVSALQRLVPPEIEIDTFDGQAWISYVLFRLKLRAAWLSPLPGLSSLLELNVRTYVRHRGSPGIVFLRMYADNRAAIVASQWLTPLCYEPADITIEEAGDPWRRVHCRPTRRPQSHLAFEFRPQGTPCEARARSLDAWLVERYRLYAPTSAGRLLSGDVTHAPWQVSDVNVVAFQDTLTPIAGPLVSAHWSPGVTARFGAFRLCQASFTHVASPGHAAALRVGQ